MYIERDRYIDIYLYLYIYIAVVQEDIKDLDYHQGGMNDLKNAGFDKYYKGSVLISNYV